MKDRRISRRIRSTQELRTALATFYECNESMVRQSLNYSQNGRLARLIRRDALEGGGYLVISLVVDHCWDDHEGTITREYPNETTVWIDKDSGEINTSVGLEVISTVYPPASLDIDALQLWFAAIEAACAKAKGFPKSYE